MAPGGWPEHGREDEALRELVAAWHGLAPEVGEKIMALVQTGDRPPGDLALGDAPRD
jgi:hypothetical protein